jgi:hypothetical protein
MVFRLLLTNSLAIKEMLYFSGDKKICQGRGYLATIVPLEPLQTGTRLIEAVRSIVEVVDSTLNQKGGTHGV